MPFHHFWESLFQNGRDPCMQFPLRAAQEHSVGSISQQRMPEGIGRVWRGTARDNQSGGDKALKPLLQELLRE